MPEAQAIDVASRPIATAQDVPQSRPRTDGLAASVNQSGCFESDRVIKCGYVERRTHKTKVFESLVLHDADTRPG